MQILKEVFYFGPKAVLDSLSRFFHISAAGGIVLILAAIFAMIVANTPLYDLYDHILHGIKFRVGFDDIGGGFDHELKKSILHWINDGLMALFFFLVGLEIKREVTEGELSTRDRALLPALAAIGGMAVPAAIFWLINQSSPENMSGWAIPAATDIAFALGILALLGSRVPVSLKILLSAVAIIDDIGAILIIALFYSEKIAFTPLYFAGGILVALFVLNRLRISNVVPYVILSVFLWVSVLESGIHATLAGVLAAFFIPMRDEKDPKHSPCEKLEHSLHPFVAFAVLPLFAFANAGVSLKGIGLETLVDPLTLGIVAGLVIGKQLGVFSMLWLSVKTGLSPMPKEANWLQLYGVSVLCGIGFTMSLFIGGLAFDDPGQETSVRLGVLIASLIAAVLGYVLIQKSLPKTEGLWAKIKTGLRV